MTTLTKDQRERAADEVVENLKTIEFSSSGYCPACSGWEVTKGQGCQQKVHTKNCWLAALLAAREKS